MFDMGGLPLPIHCHDCMPAANRPQHASLKHAESSSRRPVGRWTRPGRGNTPQQKITSGDLECKLGSMEKHWNSLCFSQALSDGPAIRQGS